jgi:hypothetical protein
MATVEAEPDLPEEVTNSLESFHEALGKVDDVLKPLLETSVDDIKEKVRCGSITYSSCWAKEAELSKTYLHVV